MMTREEYFRDAAEERSARRGCKCGGDMPGYCPGPENCPMCGDDEMENDDEHS